MKPEKVITSLKVSSFNKVDMHGYYTQDTNKEIVQFQFNTTLEEIYDDIINGNIEIDHFANNYKWLFIQKWVRKNAKNEKLTITPRQEFSRLGTYLPDNVKQDYILEICKGKEKTYITQINNNIITNFTIDKDKACKLSLYETYIRGENLEGTNNITNVNSIYVE